MDTEGMQLSFINQAPLKVPSHGEGETAKKTKISTACMSCRRRKAKCPGGTPPCSPCQKSKSTCIFDREGDGRRKGGRKSAQLACYQELLEWITDHLQRSLSKDLKRLLALVQGRMRQNEKMFKDFLDDLPGEYESEPGPSSPASSSQIMSPPPNLVARIRTNTSSSGGPHVHGHWSPGRRPSVVLSDMLQHHLASDTARSLEKPQLRVDTNQVSPIFHGHQPPGNRPAGVLSCKLQHQPVPDTMMQDSPIDSNHLFISPSGPCNGPPPRSDIPIDIPMDSSEQPLGQANAAAVSSYPDGTMYGYGQVYGLPTTFPTNIATNYTSAPNVYFTGIPFDPYPPYPPMVDIQAYDEHDPHDYDIARAWL